MGEIMLIHKNAKITSLKSLKIDKQSNLKNPETRKNKTQNQVKKSTFITN